MERLIASLSLLSLLFLAAAPRLARAEEGKVELFPLRGEKLTAGNAALPERVADLIAVAIEETGKTVERAESSLTDTALVLGCDSTRLGCLEQLTGLLSTQEMLWGKVVMNEAGAVELRLSRFIMGKGLRNTTAVDSSAGTLDERAQALVDSVRGFLGLTVIAPPADLTVADRGPADASSGQTPAAEASLPATDPGGFDLGRVKGWTWGVAGAGAFSLIAGGVLLSAASGVRADVEAANPRTTEDFETLTRDERRGLTLTRGGSGLLIGGGSVVALSALFAVFQGASSGPAGSQAPAPTMTFAPMLAPGTAGLSLQISLP